MQTAMEKATLNLKNWKTLAMFKGCILTHRKITIFQVLMRTNLKCIKQL